MTTGIDSDDSGEEEKMSFLPRPWNKMFVIELGENIDYPTEEIRWSKFGAPLTRIFDPYFKGEKLIQWFKDESGNHLAGVNIACFESISKWEDEQNDQKALELFLRLSTPVNDFFVQFGSSAAITGLCEITFSVEELAVELLKTKPNSGSNPFWGQLPVVCDMPDTSKPMNLIKKNERYFVTFIGKVSNITRFRELTEEQYLEIVKASESDDKE